MDYEEKYKEALEKARKIWYETEFDYEKGMMAEIFPELKESDDERIRKEIISIVKSYRESCITEGTHRFDDCISWLEKQREQKPTWSKDDEQFFKTALWHISNSISNGKSTDINCDTTDWFKSLKYRIKGE